MRNTTLLLATAAVVLAVATAPSASAAPSGQSSSDPARLTTYQAAGNAQVYTSPQVLPLVLPPSINPRWRGLGYSARFPKYGFDPKWQAFGYNPKYSGFQPRPSVLRVPHVPVSQALDDTGGSTLYQTTGNAQINTRTGGAAKQANPPHYPSALPTAATGGSTMNQGPGHAEITAQPGPAAQNAAQQATYFPVSDLPTR